FQRVAARPDQVRQQRTGHESRALLFLLEDDLRQGQVGEILAALVVGYEDVLALLDHLGDVFQRDVPFRFSIVEFAVWIPLDHWHLMSPGSKGTGTELLSIIAYPLAPRQSSAKRPGTNCTRSHTPNIMPVADQSRLRD